MPKIWFSVGFLAILSLFCAVLNGQPSAAIAATGGLQATPALKEVVISDNESQSAFPIHLRNNTRGKITLQLSLVDFGTLDETGGVAFLGEEGNLKRDYGLVGWARLDKSSITLMPGQQGYVGVTILNRSTLALGGHYGAVLFKLAAPPGTDPQKVQLDQVFSSLILVKKKGGESYNLSFDKLEPVKNIYTLPGNVKLRFHNGGNVHVAPAGSVRLLDPLNREVARGPINPEIGQVLPESYRVFRTSLEAGRTAWIPGRYRIIVDYTFEGQGYSTTYQSSFIFLNGLGMVAIACLCVALAGAVWRRKQIRAYLRRLPFKKILRPKKPPAPKAPPILVAKLTPKRPAKKKSKSKKITKIKIDHQE